MGGDKKNGGGTDGEQRGDNNGGVRMEKVKN